MRLMALDTAISALQEREERSEGCEYCKGNVEVRSAIQLPTDVGYTWIDEDGYINNGYGECKIHFCPMCGRRLEG